MSKDKNKTNKFEDFQDEAMGSAKSKASTSEYKVSTNFDFNNHFMQKIGELESKIEGINSKKYIVWNSFAIWTILVALVGVFLFFTWKIPLIHHQNMKAEMTSVQNEIKRSRCRNNVLRQCVETKCKFKSIIKEQDECESKFN